MDAEKQKEALQLMLETGFAGGDSLAVLREKLGIDGDTWEAWLREGGMPGDLVSLSKAMAEMCAPWVWASLLELTRDGSIPAMKLYFELCKEKSAAGMPDSAGDREIMALRQEIFGGVTDRHEADAEKRTGSAADGAGHTAGRSELTQERSELMSERSELASGRSELASERSGDGA